MTEDRHEIEGVKRREQRSGFPWFAAGFFLLVCFLIVVSLLFPAKVVRTLKEILGTDAPPAPPAIEEPLPAPERPALPAPVRLPEPVEVDPGPPPPPAPVGRLRPPDGTDVRKLTNGVDLKVDFQTERGARAAGERLDPESYTAEFTLRVRLPEAAQSLDELHESNPDLGTVLPGLETLLPKGKVSPWYGKLYENKTTRIRARATRLGEIVSRHNFYDCETMLNLRNPETGRRAFLIQGDMDVVSDGSDGDRLPEMPEEIVNSANYQPFTSYQWKKTGDTPNPMLEGWERRLRKARKELKDPAVTEDRKEWVRERIEKLLKPGIEDMKAMSYLVADYDPFVVMPTHMVLDRNDPYAPNIGDYVVVVHGGKAYPAIVGDAGPTYKVGEASLRMAKELDSRSNPYRRPVSDLAVTYLVFPRSAESPRRAPDYEKWKARCQELLDEIGGLGEGIELHSWTDRFPKPEPPPEEVPQETPETDGTE